MAPASIGASLLVSVLASVRGCKTNLQHVWDSSKRNMTWILHCMQSTENSVTLGAILFDDVCSSAETWENRAHDYCPSYPQAWDQTLKGCLCCWLTSLKWNPSSMLEATRWGLCVEDSLSTSVVSNVAPVFGWCKLYQFASPGGFWLASYKCVRQLSNYTYRTTLAQAWSPNLDGSGTVPLRVKICVDPPTDGPWYLGQSISQLAGCQIQ